MNIITRNIPVALIALHQWVLWRYEDRGGPKPTKVCYQAREGIYRARSNDPRTWASFDTALQMLRHHAGRMDGIGFVISPNDPFAGIDLDDVWLSDAAETPRWVEGILERFADTYSEESPSGKGVKIWCRATMPRPSHHEWKIEHGAIEIYDHARFFTVTGRSAGITAITDHQQDIEALVANLEGDHQGQRAPRIEGKILYGMQHSTLVRMGGTMHRRGFSLEAIEAALLVENRIKCERPGPERNIRRIVASMARWER